MTVVNSCGKELPPRGAAWNEACEAFTVLRQTIFSGKRQIDLENISNLIVHLTILSEVIATEAPRKKTIPPWKNEPDFNNYRFESQGKLIERKVVGELNGFPVADYIDVNTGESLNLTTEEMIVLPVGNWHLIITTDEQTGRESEAK